VTCWRELPSTERLRAVLHQAIARQPGERLRLQRAAQVLVTRCVRPRGAHGWWVAAADRGPGYWVRHTGAAWQCTCPDHTYRRVACKHIQACILRTRLGADGRGAGG
jgi:hypothetical protein